MVICIFLAIVFFFIHHASWLYNSHLTATAARQSARYLATTDNASGAKKTADKYLKDKLLFAKVDDISVHWSGDTTTSTVTVKMFTAFPGMGKLIDPKNASKTNIQIKKEATVPGEHKYTNPEEYN